jgi:hypothetical protein
MTYMVKSLHRIILFFTLLFAPVNILYAQGYQLSNQAKVSVITCGSGDQLYSIFGHTGLRITDPAHNLDIVYNYGTFDFSTPNFYGKFVKGDLDYYVSASTFQQFLYEYQSDNRDVFEQELRLSPVQKQQLLEALNKNLFTDERSYRYKFIDKNCTTMVMDKVNEVLVGTKITKNKPYESSYRAVINPYLETLYYEKLGINIIFGHRPDEEAIQLFLPSELMASLAQLKVEEKPLVTTTTSHFLQDKSLLKTVWWNTSYTLLFGLLLIVFSNNRYVYLTYCTLAGVVGLFLIGVGLYSSHREVLWNYNVLLFNPLYLSLVIFFWRKKTIPFKKIWKVSLLLLLVYTLYLAFQDHFTILIPFIAMHAVLLYRLKRWL